MSQVVNLEALPTLRTPEDRVAFLFSLVSEKRKAELLAQQVASGNVVAISSRHQALEYGDGWQRAYEAMESAYTLACAQRDASETLLRLATEELERLKEITK